MIKLGKVLNFVMMPPIFPHILQTLLQVAGDRLDLGVLFLEVFSGW
jgi:hypothetical protein